MTQQATNRLLQEAEFIDRYTQYYRRQFAQVMQKTKPGSDSVRCIRMCLEALNMMHGSKQTVIEALGQSSPLKS
ncbi:hypothetical protein BH10PLA1_BH10PLA1_05370 [soil metagenome]